MLPSQLRKVGAGRLLQFPGLSLLMDTGANDDPISPMSEECLQVVMAR